MILKMLFITQILLAWAYDSTHVKKINEEFKLRLHSTKIQISEKNKISLKEENGFINIKGLREGPLEIKIGTQIESFYFLTSQNECLWSELNKYSLNTVGLKVDLKDNFIVVLGRLYSIVEYQRLVKLAKDCSGAFQLKAELTSEIKSKILSEIQNELKTIGFSQLKITYQNGFHYYTQQEASSQRDLFRALGRLGIEWKKDSESIQESALLKLRVSIAEVKKDQQIQWGFQWPQNISATLLPDGQKTLDAIVFNAKAFEAQGFGKILAEPSLLCRSGSEAEFWAGGEFPIKILNFKTQDVVWKKYGVILKFKPLVDASKKIQLQIETEISSIDHSQIVDGIPALFTDKVTSQIFLNEEQTIVLSGLLKNEEGKSHEGLPGLSRIPILGSLFSSQQYKSNQTELVIFIKPEIL